MYMSEYSVRYDLITYGGMTGDVKNKLYFCITSENQDKLEGDR